MTGVLIKRDPGPPLSRLFSTTTTTLSTTSNAYDSWAQLSEEMFAHLLRVSLPCEGTVCLTDHVMCVVFSALANDEEQREDLEENVQTNELPAGSLPVPPVDKHHALHRGLSARQVSMIAIAGTIGTGLFLGTGRSLAQGGPASMLIGYAIVGFIVYVTLLLLGEMGTQYPVAGKDMNMVLSLSVTYLCLQGHSTPTRPASSPLHMGLPFHGTIGSMMQSQLPQI